MRLYLNQSDIDKAIKSYKGYDPKYRICKNCPIAQMFRRLYHGDVKVSYYYVIIDSRICFEISHGSKAYKITSLDRRLWHTIKPQHLSFMEV